jgi:hypothetical protein
LATRDVVGAFVFLSMETTPFGTAALSQLPVVNHLTSAYDVNSFKAFGRAQIPAEGDN